VGGILKLNERAIAVNVAWKYRNARSTRQLRRTIDHALVPRQTKELAKALARCGQPELLGPSTPVNLLHVDLKSRGSPDEQAIGLAKLQILGKPLQLGRNLELLQNLSDGLKIRSVAQIENLLDMAA
jgi:hypothetical protein